MYMYALRPLLPGRVGTEEYLREYYASTLHAEVPGSIHRIIYKRFAKELMRQQNSNAEKEKRAIHMGNQQLSMTPCFRQPWMARDRG